MQRQMTITTVSGSGFLVQGLSNAEFGMRNAELTKLKTW